MLDRMIRLLTSVAMLVMVTAPAFGQGTATSSLSGVVVDTGGGVIPGATVVVKNNATARRTEARHQRDRAVLVPGLDAGTYTVTVSLTGFKTAVVNDVRLIAGTPGRSQGQARSRRADRDGRGQGRHRTGADAVDRRHVDAHRRAAQGAAAGLAQRALRASRSCPASTPPAARAARPSTACRRTRSTSPSTASAPATMLQSTDGFFSMVTPRLDAVEEVTVTGAVPGAGGGAGSVQVGVRHPLGHQQVRRQRLPLLPRDPRLNSNYYFNKVNGLAEERRRSCTPTAAASAVRSCFRALRRPRQGVLLLQLRAPVPAAASDAHAHDPATRRAERRLPLRRHVGGVSSSARVEPRCAGGRRTARSSTLDPIVGRLLQPRSAAAPRRPGNDQRRSAPQHAAVRLPERRARQPVRADDRVSTST